MTRGLSATSRAQLRGAGPWTLLVDDTPTSVQVRVAGTLRERALGLLGRRAVPQALLLHPCASVHSLGMLVALQVAYLDADLQVLDVADLPRWRVHRPRRRAAAVLEAATGALSDAGVRPGARLGLQAAG